MLISDNKNLRVALDSCAMSRSESDQDNYQIIQMINHGNPLIQFQNCESFNDPPFSLCHSNEDKRRMMASILMMGTARNIDKFSAESVARNIDLVMNLYNHMQEFETNILEDDPFLKDIALPMFYGDNFVFSFHTYQKETLFHFGEPVESGYRDILQLGYFRENMNYPYITKDGEYFSSISVHEIEEGRKLVNQVSGNVLITGLNIGYIPYLAHLKDSVKHVTIIEEDEEVISLFKDEILSQFKHPEKINVVHGDVKEYISHLEEEYNHVIISHYKDSMNGVYEYIDIKKSEKEHKKCKYHYYIEDSILSNIKSALLMMCVAESSDERKDLYEQFTQDKETAHIFEVLEPIFSDYKVENVKCFEKLFQNNNLNKMFR